MVTSATANSITHSIAAFGDLYSDPPTSCFWVSQYGNRGQTFFSKKVSLPLLDRKGKILPQTRATLISHAVETTDHVYNNDNNNEL